MGVREGRLEVAVLADDLTGALASAARLREHGLHPAVQWRQEAGPPGTDAVVVDMRTRDRGSDPRARARAWAVFLRAQGCRRYEQRLDSTLRGDPAAELAGLLDGAGLADPWVLAVPAFPDAGRVTRAGRQVLTGGAGCRAARSVDVAGRVFPGGGAVPVGLAEVEAGPEAVAAAIRSAAGRGARRFVADATSAAHLAVAAAAAALLEREGVELVTASSGAWLRWYPELAPLPDDFVLVVVSSATAQNAEQLAILAGDRPVATLSAAGARTASVPAGPQATVVVETIGAVAAGPDQTGRPWGAPDGDGQADHLALEAVAAAAGLLERARAAGRHCRGVVVSGGHTASRLMDALGAERLWASGEVEPLCPAGLLVGGPWSGLPVVTKGGMVGAGPTLANLVTSLWKETTWQATPSGDP